MESRNEVIVFLPIFIVKQRLSLHHRLQGFQGNPPYLSLAWECGHRCHFQDIESNPGIPIGHGRNVIEEVGCHLDGKFPQSPLLIIQGSVKYHEQLIPH